MAVPQAGGPNRVKRWLWARFQHPFLSTCQLQVKWIASPGSCHQAFPAQMDRTLEPWVKLNYWLLQLLLLGEVFLSRPVPDTSVTSQQHRKWLHRLHGKRSCCMKGCMFNPLFSKPTTVAFKWSTLFLVVRSAFLKLLMLQATFFSNMNLSF